MRVYQFLRHIRARSAFSTVRTMRGTCERLRRGNPGPGAASLASATAALAASHTRPRKSSCRSGAIARASRADQPSTVKRGKERRLDLGEFAHKPWVHRRAPAAQRAVRSSDDLVRRFPRRGPLALFRGVPQRASGRTCRRLATSGTAPATTRYFQRDPGGHVRVQREPRTRSHRRRRALALARLLPPATE